MINDRIRYPQVRVIDDLNQQLGVMETREAIDLARDRGYDLILVAAQATPPVCRIMDYGKFKYEKSKREKTAHKKSAATELKMVRLHPRTSEHDRSILVRHSERFLREGHKVRVVCQFKGRENAYPQLGRAQLDAVAQALGDFAIVEGTINKQGREMAMMLNPKPGLKPIPKAPSKQDLKSGKVAEVEVAALEGVEGEAVEGAISEEDAAFEALQARIIAEAEAHDEAEVVDAVEAAGEVSPVDGASVDGASSETTTETDDKTTNNSAASDS